MWVITSVNRDDLLDGGASQSSVVLKKWTDRLQPQPQNL
jgi:lipoate synthase